MPTYRVGIGKDAELCDICLKNKYSQLCDYAVGSGIIPSTTFKEITHTCDKKLCMECAVPLWTDCDVCPEHAVVVAKNLTNKIKSNKNILVRYSSQCERKV